MKLTNYRVLSLELLVVWINSLLFLRRRYFSYMVRAILQDIHHWFSPTRHTMLPKTAIRHNKYMYTNQILVFPFLKSTIYRIYINICGTVVPQQMDCVRESSPCEEWRALDILSTSLLKEWRPPS